MTKIDIFSGFLGAGKTTLIKKLIREAYAGQKLVLIENEFGEIGIDGGFLRDSGVTINEMNSGCICCSLVGDFGKALQQVIEQFHPDRILIEPSGVGKLSDVILAVQNLDIQDVQLNSFTTIADAIKFKMYMKNFGEFFNNQIEHAGTVVLSRTDGMKEAKLDACIELIRSLNQSATIITTPWDQLSGEQILAAMEQKNTLSDALERLAREEAVCPVCGHVHDDDAHDHECCCHEHHEHDAHDHECCCHEHHHEHDAHDHECCCHEHHEHDAHDHECCCHEHHHEHDAHCDCGHDHHHHHADEVFTSWGRETHKKFSAEQIHGMLAALEEDQKYGMVLRAKGFVAGEDGKWIYFDYVPGESNVRFGTAEITGRLCVIGSKLQEDQLAALFEL